MKQPTDHPPQLPESSEPSPVVVQEDKKRYLYEGSLIVLSVLLALFLNEVRNSWQESRRTGEIIENLTNELKKNKATVEGQYSYLTIVLDNIDSALAHEKYRSDLFVTQGFNISGIAPEGIFSAGFIDEIAWEIAKNNGIYSKVDFETVSILSDIYQQQSMVKKGYESVGAIISTREARDPENGIETLNMIKYDAYKGYSYDRMPNLLKRYDTALEKLEATKE